MRFPRYTKRDVEAFVRIHAALAQLHQSLNQSNWAGRVTAITVVEQTDLLISELFNKCERAVLGAASSAAEAGDVNDQSGHTASVEVERNLDLNANGQERI